MALEKPPGVPQELWERVLAHQKQAIEFEEREQRLLSSLRTGDEKMLDRALVQLREDGTKLKAQQMAIWEELKGYGVTK